MLVSGQPPHSLLCCVVPSRSWEPGVTAGWGRQPRRGAWARHQQGGVTTSPHGQEQGAKSQLPKGCVAGLTPWAQPGTRGDSGSWFINTDTFWLLPAPG